MSKTVRTNCKQKRRTTIQNAQGNVLSIYRKSTIFGRGESFFFCEEQTMYGSSRLGTEQVEHSMRGLVTKDGLTDEITRAREQHGDDWQQRLDEQYEGRFYERLQEAWGNEWSTRLDLLLQGNNDGWLIEQIRNESYTLQAGNKRYELSNHLGNVLAVVSDKKVQTDGVVWQAELVSAQDYFPFGMAMPGRSTTATYKYGFNGQEKDTEMGEGIYTAEFWQYDARLGRRMNVDPVTFPWQSAYATFNNNPIALSDPSGATAEDPVKKEKPQNELGEVVITGKNESSKLQPLIVKSIESMKEALPNIQVTQHGSIKPKSGTSNSKGAPMEERSFEMFFLRNAVLELITDRRRFQDIPTHEQQRYIENAEDMSQIITHKLYKSISKLVPKLSQNRAQNKKAFQKFMNQIAELNKVAFEIEQETLVDILDNGDRVCVLKVPRRVYITGLEGHLIQILNEWDDEEVDFKGEMFDAGDGNGPQPVPIRIGTQSGSYRIRNSNGGLLISNNYKLRFYLTITVQ